ncbi:uncharacterized protein IWZ02DRAFT_8352 [Phyllosticta citriasiana]|uniref:uncharacterized protein n=1 Tax=Phyllosticta citriasiana TaxID=595635 RepID=UPI0030FDCD39
MLCKPWLVAGREQLFRISRNPPPDARGRTASTARGQVLRTRYPPLFAVDRRDHHAQSAVGRGPFAVSSLQTEKTRVNTIMVVYTYIPHYLHPPRCARQGDAASAAPCSCHSGPAELWGPFGDGPRASSTRPKGQLDSSTRRDRLCLCPFCFRFFEKTPLCHTWRRGYSRHNRHQEIKRRTQYLPSASMYILTLVAERPAKAGKDYCRLTSMQCSIIHWRTNGN